MKTSISTSAGLMTRFVKNSSATGTVRDEKPKPRAPLTNAPNSVISASARNPGSMPAMLRAGLILSKTNVLGCYAFAAYEITATSLPYRGGPSRAERFGSRRGPAHLATRGLQANQGLGGRAGGPGVRTPRQAPGRGDRAGQGGDGDRRAHPVGGAEPAPRRRRVRQREAGHADHRRDPHAGALLAAERRDGVQAALPEGEAGHPPGQPDADLRAGAGRRSGFLRGYRGHRPVRRYCLAGGLPMETPTW